MNRGIGTASAELYTEQRTPDKQTRKDAGFSSEASEQGSSEAADIPPAVSLVLGQAHTA